MSFAVVFPGQGSQALGMLDSFLTSDNETIRDVAKATVAEASDAINLDMAALLTAGPAEALNATENTQPALLTTSIAMWRALLAVAETDLKPVAMAGHSLGEYSALVAAEALNFADAVQLVHKRGQLMQAAVPAGEGAMAAVIGLNDDEVMATCAEAQATANADSNTPESETREVVAAVNFNAPGQVVIAGSTAAVAIAEAMAKSNGAKMVKRLPVSVPSHCALMAQAAEQLNDALLAVKIQPPTLPVIHNVDAAAHQDPDDIRQALVAQLHSPVQWVACMQAIIKQGGADMVLECGSGRVLTGLNKRIDRSLTLLNLQHVDGIAPLVEALC